VDRLKGVVLVLAVALAATVTPPFARAQVVVSTFGPGDSYDHTTGFLLAVGNSYAQPFVYSGAEGVLLQQIRLALDDATDPYTISFRRGIDLNSADVLEVWTEDVSAPGIVTMTSVLVPVLTPGDMYWIVAQSPTVPYYPHTGLGTWFFNDHGAVGAGASFLFAPNWQYYSGLTTSAFDVTVAPADVTPEPVTMVLLGTGLVGIGAARLRRRKKSVG
jgi:hypothetical protein